MTRPLRVVVLGTGTGVGKTWVTAALARALRAQGAAVLALKPIETGVPSDEAGSRPDTDAGILAAASGSAPTDAPYRFAPPVSPHLAARLAGSAIELGSIVEHVEREEHGMTSHVLSVLLVETAGGCLTPLRAGVTNVELALALEPALWVLVAPDALGVLHDVTATLVALRARARPPDHVVLSQAREPDASTGTNAAELAGLGIVKPVAVLERGEVHGIEPLARALFERAAGRTAPPPVRP